MVELGYWLSSEEHPPADLVRYARRAEELGFPFALISDHYHPWIDRQGHAPFVWGVIGAIAEATQRLRLGTAVTRPTMRLHPAIIAQAAATDALLMPGRFFLGVGTGENLNEHILGEHWPAPPVRLERLEEAIAVIRLLWQGGMKSHYGAHYRVEDARVYDLPEPPPPMMVAASGPRGAEAAGRLGDGFIGVAPSVKLIEARQQLPWVDTSERSHEQMARILYLTATGPADPTRASLPFHLAVNGTTEAGDTAELVLAGDATELVKAGVADTIQGIGVPPLTELVAKATAKAVAIHV